MVCEQMCMLCCNGVRMCFESGRLDCLSVSRLPVFVILCSCMTLSHAPLSFLATLAPVCASLFVLLRRLSHEACFSHVPNLVRIMSYHLPWARDTSTCATP